MGRPRRFSSSWVNWTHSSPTAPMTSTFCVPSLRSVILIFFMMSCSSLVLAAFGQENDHVAVLERLFFLDDQVLLAGLVADQIVGVLAVHLLDERLLADRAAKFHAPPVGNDLV